MGYEKALELLGKEDTVPETEVTKIVVPPDKVEKVTQDKGIAGEFDAEPELSESDQEIGKLKSKLRELEERQQHDGQDTKEQLGSVNNVIAELRGEIKASPTVVQSGQILDTLEKLQSRLDLLEETLGAEIEAAKCPKCGNIVGWNNLPVEERDNGQSKFPLSLVMSQVGGKRCPVCKYFEEVEEEQKCPQIQPLLSN